MIRGGDGSPRRFVGFGLTRPQLTTLAMCALILAAFALSVLINTVGE